MCVCVCVFTYIYTYIFELPILYPSGTEDTYNQHVRTHERMSRSWIHCKTTQQRTSREINQKPL